MRDGRSMRIGELAAHIGASPRALRHYEEQGLLAPERLPNGYRVYDALAINRAAAIKELLDVGLTSEDIRPHLESGCLDTPPARAAHCQGELGAIHARLGTLNELIARLEAVRDRLAEHAATVEAAVAGRHPD
ncbi:MerR family transcriptional regulator [Streptomyces sp. DSM 44915]|uniref:MerR family transcriptional regulator n=1 Tax=Streptomyces chisholmiae TaxID=3075540 RepID=A0ABU2JIC2_9ACTN|nr:MerR family transcriptional regulator [Streptomyces sp. DSM 44915]MDT0264738.1 MerR family transcriptional regulator [Streptomyces sp. DSM 44915]